jgi:hypothetical protein
MASSSKLEYDATEMLDNMCPKFEVKLLADPAKMIRRVIKDDGNEPVATVDPLPEHSSITDLMEAPRIPMMRITTMKQLIRRLYHLL